MERDHPRYRRKARSVGIYIRSELWERVLANPGLNLSRAACEGISRELDRLERASKKEGQ